jgi:outer membrane receptor for ferrienterochelin and colicins
VIPAQARGLAIAALGAAVAFVPPAAPLAAQQRDSARVDTARTRLETVIVTAARREQRLKDAVVPTEVITRAEIDRTGATDIAALLQQFTGMQLDGGVASFGGVGGGQGIMLQGMDSRRVLILIDGQQVIGRVNGDLDLSRFPLAGVDRVEIVKGPQSTLYGSEAIGGVVNIVTRPPSGGLSSELQLVGGNRGRMDGTAGARGTLGRFRVSGDASLRGSDLAVGIPGDLGTRNDRWTAMPAVEFRANDEWTLRSSGLISEQTQRYRFGQLFRFVDDQQLGGRVSGEWRRGVHRLTPLLHLSRFDHLERASTGSRPVPGSGDRDIQSLAEFELTGTTLVGGALLDAGLEARRERINSDRIPGAARSLDAIEGYSQLTFARGPVTVVPGLRLVEHSVFGGVAAPRLAVMWRPRDAFAVRASAGRGFRAPDFKELYLSFANPAIGYAVVGNPELRPERSTSTQLGVEWTTARGWLRAGVFDNDFRDFIAFTGDPSGAFTYENVERGSTRGLEAEGSLTHEAWRVDVGYAYLDARDGVGRRLPSRPMHSGRVALNAPLPRSGTLAATWVVTGSAPITVGLELEATEQQPTFDRLDLKATVPVRGGFRLLAGVDNAFDRAVGRQWPGFTGRLVYAGVNWRR